MSNRKDKHILPMWTPNTGNELHGLQLKILSRALELIKVGGVVCYSTCSLNPVEDEAVVAAAMLGLSKSSMKFELMAWPNILLPGFLHRPGIIDWKVAFYDHNNVVHDGDDFGSLTFCVKPADAEEAGISDAVTTLWPPKQLEHLQLDRCVRLFPQDNNTGGFFLVAIKRIK
jgi:multisite-specific tRNA:(cytosine-C5)-methyltransferase